MPEKAEQGIWPSYAPLGYRNLQRGDGNKVIAPDPELAAIIRPFFERYATGSHPIGEVARIGRDQGLSLAKRGNSTPSVPVHKILRNRLYMGDFE